jgi:hypothetical protein
MRTTSFVVVALGAALAPLVGQTEAVHHSPGAMRVAVVDLNGTALPGAELELPMLEVKFAVPEGGTLLVNHVPAGTYVLQVRRLGYAMQTRLVTVRGDTQSVRFALDKLVATLDTVNVTARENDRSRDFERRLRAGHGKVFTSNDIEKSHAVLLTQFLETVHGVKLQSVSGGYSERAPLGASGVCPSGVLVYLDGVAVNALEDTDPARGFPSFGAPPPRMSGRPSGSSTTGPTLSPSGSGRPAPVAAAIAASEAASVPNPTRSSAALPPFDINTIALSRIAAMEVYPEGAPAQTPYGGGSRCGLVLLWSKPR